MSVIIQAGHQSSHANRLMQILYERGLNEPIKSHTYQLTANEITEKLAKVLVKNSSIINTKIIDGLIVDLLLANLDQDDWGWSDENNLDTLLYWQQAEQNSRFILVFDSPKLLLSQLLGSEVTPNLLEQTINSWLIYHQKMLDFLKITIKIAC